MATSKLLVVALLVVANLLAGWTVVTFLPPCAGSSDDALFCLPGWEYLPNGAIYAIVVCILAWATFNVYEHFTDDDEANRAAKARKLLVLPLLVVGDPVFLMVLIFLLLPCQIPSSGGDGGSAAAPCPSSDGGMIFCLPEIPYMPRGAVFFILGGIVGWASTIIYQHFTHVDDAMDGKN